MSTARTFDQYLEGTGLVAAEALKNARLLQQQQPTPLPTLLIRLGALSEEVLYQEMSRYSGMLIISDEALHAAQTGFATTVARLGLQTSWCQTQGIIL